MLLAEAPQSDRLDPTRALPKAHLLLSEVGELLLGSLSALKLGLQSNERVVRDGGTLLFGGLAVGSSSLGGGGRLRGRQKGLGAQTGNCNCSV